MIKGADGTHGVNKRNTHVRLNTKSSLNSITVADLKHILTLPVEDRQIIQEVVGYSIINDMNMVVFGEEQKKMIEDRLKKYAKRSDAVFKFDDLKSAVIDKFK